MLTYGYVLFPVSFFHRKRKQGTASRWDLSVGQVSLLDYVLVHFDSYPLPSILSAEFLIWQEL